MTKKLEYVDDNYSVCRGWSSVGSRVEKPWGYNTKGTVRTPQGEVTVEADLFTYQDQPSAGQSSLLLQIGKTVYRRDFEVELSEISLIRQAFKFARDIGEKL